MTTHQLTMRDFFDFVEENFPTLFADNGIDIVDKSNFAIFVDVSRLCGFRTPHIYEHVGDYIADIIPYMYSKRGTYPIWGL